MLLNPTTSGGVGGGSSSSFNNEDEADYYTEHDTRKRDISLNDIVHKVSLNEFIQVNTNSRACQLMAEFQNLLRFQGKLQGWGQYVGESAYANTMVNLDVETRDTLKEYITL